MYFLDAGKIIEAGKEKIFDDKLYQKWLIEQPEKISFEQYKENLLKLAKLKNRTKKEKENDMKETRKIAQKAKETLDPNGLIAKELRTLRKLNKKNNSIKKVDLMKKVDLKKKV